MLSDRGRKPLEVVQRKWTPVSPRLSPAESPIDVQA